jgi:outer membrane protein TolC
MMRKLMITIGILAVALTAMAQDSLLHYQKVAVQNNPAIKQKYAQFEAALQKVPQVGSLPDPTLNLGVFLTPMEVMDGKQVADIQLMQMFPWFGTLKAAKDEMGLMAKGEFERLRDTQLQLNYDVERIWYELMVIRQNRRIQQENLELLRTIERMALVKFQSPSTSGGASMPTGNVQPSAAAAPSSGGSMNMGGMGNTAGTAPTGNAAPAGNMQPGMGTGSSATGLTDLYRIRMEMGELENNIALLNNNETTVLARFNSLLNRQAAAVVFTPDTLVAKEVNRSFTEISDTIFAHNPMLKMLEYEQQSLDARGQMVSRMGYPMIGLGVNYSIINKSEMSTSSMNGKDMIMPMVSVTLPIYRKKYKAMKAETEFQKRAVHHGYEAMANDLRTEYFQAVERYEDAQRRVNLYTNQQQLAEQTLQIMVKSYSVAATSLTEVLRVRQQLTEYQLKKTQAIADLNNATAWFKRLMASSQTL